MKNDSNWWLGVVTGLVFIFIGWFLLTNTAITTLMLVQILGLYWLLAGILDVISSIFSQTVESRGWKLAGGVLGIMVGLIILNAPVTSAIFHVAMYVYFVAFTFIFNGAVRIFLGRKVQDNQYKWSLGGLVLGCVYILVGLTMLGNTVMSAVVLLSVVGYLALLGGLISLIAAFMFRGEPA